MDYATNLLVPLFRAELELCGISAGSTVAVLSQNQERSAYSAAFEAASVDLGATTFHIDVPVSPTTGTVVARAPGIAHQTIVVEALKKTDLIVDLVRLLWSPVQTELLSGGSRMITCHEPVDVLAQLFPTKERRMRVEQSGALLQDAKTLRITSGAGTDLAYKLGPYSVLLQYGYSDTPGRWDHFASALAATAGADDGVDGDLVLSPGDLLLPFKTYVTRPLRITIRRGKIESVDGDGEATLIRNYLAAHDDERAYRISHVGWGLNERARWHALALNPGANGIENRSFNGSVMFSTGPNTELGGSNDTACHIDIPMRGCSLFLDGVPVIQDDTIVHPALADAPSHKVQIGD